MKEISVETHTLVFTELSEYRLRPNPDVPEGFGGGAVLEWRDTEHGAKWQGYFFIAPEAIEALGKALLAAAESSNP